MKLPTPSARNQTPMIMPAGADRRQLRHGAQADRAKAQFSNSMKQISQGKPPGADERGIRDRNENGEAEADEEQAPGEFGGAARVAAAKLDPEQGEDGGERDDEHRVQGLKVAGAKQPPERRVPAVQVGISFCEKGEGGPGLLEGGPEERRRKEQNEDGSEPAALAGVCSFWW